MGVYVCVYIFYMYVCMVCAYIFIGTFTGIWVHACESMFMC